jgi:hypothetical protein
LPTKAVAHGGDAAASTVASVGWGGSVYRSSEGRIHRPIPERRPWRPVYSAARAGEHVGAPYAWSNTSPSAASDSNTGSFG